MPEMRTKTKYVFVIINYNIPLNITCPPPPSSNLSEAANYSSHTGLAVLCLRPFALAVLLTTAVPHLLKPWTSSYVKAVGVL